MTMHGWPTGESGHGRTARVNPGVGTGSELRPEPRAREELGLNSCEAEAWNKPVRKTGSDTAFWSFLVAETARRPRMQGNGHDFVS